MDEIKRPGISPAKAVLIDLGGILEACRDQVLEYIDMSPDGSTTAAINNIYDVLRWAETREGA